MFGQGQPSPLPHITAFPFEDQGLRSALDGSAFRRLGTEPGSANFQQGPLQSEFGSQGQLSPFYSLRRSKPAFLLPLETC